MKKIMAKKSSLRLLSCIMAFCMCITVFAGTVGFSAFAVETTNVWDGKTDTYADMTALLADYYHIKTPNQLHAAIKFQGGGNDFKLDNDIYLNENVEDYLNWRTTPPANTWHFNQASNWDAKKMTPFTGTIDGCGYTVYGLYSNTTGNYNGLIGATTGDTVIKNLNVRNVYLNGSKRAGVIVGIARGGNLVLHF